MKQLLLLCSALVSFCTVACGAEMPHYPHLKVTTMMGADWQLSAHRGHWVVVNFWATWCASCIKEMPEISAFVKAHKQVEAIGLAFEDSDKADIQAFLKKHAVVYPVAQVDPFKPPAEFDAPRGLPTSYLISPDGVVAKKFVGPIDAADLARAIGIKPGP